MSMMNSLSGSGLSTISAAENISSSPNFWTDLADFFGWGSARRDREWQEKMRSTEIQTQVNDMLSSGINPIMAASIGGATTPRGSTAVSNAGGIGTLLTGAANLVSAFSKNSGKTSSGSRGSAAVNDALSAAKSLIKYLL